MNKKELITELVKAGFSIEEALKTASDPAGTKPEQAETQTAAEVEADASPDFSYYKGGNLYMEVNDILTAISTVGFPIVACIALYYQNLKTTKALSDLTSAITELKCYMERKNNE